MALDVCVSGIDFALHEDMIVKTCLSQLAPGSSSTELLMDALAQMMPIIIYSVSKNVFVSM